MTDAERPANRNDWPANDPRAGYRSIMCSTPAERIAEIGQAIDDLAGEAGTPAVRSDTDPIARVAELWAQLTELDPELAKRLPGYQQL